MEKKKQAQIFFFICLGICFILMFLVWRPFINIILVSMICAVVLYPLHNKILKLVRQQRTLASLFTCFLLIIIVIVPLVFIITLLAQEATQAYLTLNYRLQKGIPLIDQKVLDNIFLKIKEYLPFVAFKGKSAHFYMTQMMQFLLDFIVKHSTDILNNIVNTIFYFALWIFTLFYFFRDGSKWLALVSDVVPLTEKQKNLIMEKFRDVSKATMVGIFLTAMVQGFLGGIGFWIVGISPILWGTVMTFASLIPMVGAALIWLPCGLALIISGNMNGGIFILVWGAVVVSTVDNFLRPYLMKGSTKVNPLWILFSVLGGLKLFGFPGILIGPLILTMTITFVYIYSQEYS
jgi:predicted PurR-regulated permease PerM